MKFTEQTGVRIENALSPHESDDRTGLNREPWFVIKRILEFVEFVVNPVFSYFRTAGGKLSTG